MTARRPGEHRRTGYFDAAEVAVHLKHVPDGDVRDFIEWGFRTGMRKGEIAKLEWSMLDRSGPTWVLNLPGSITKNGRGRALGLQGEVRSIIERRIRARRLDCPPTGSSMISAAPLSETSSGRALTLPSP